MKSRANASGHSGRGRLILSRYCTVLRATAVATIVLPVALHLLWRLWVTLPLQRTFPLGQIWILIAAFLVCHFLAKLIRQQNYRLCDIRRYPPIWISAPTAFMIVYIVEHTLSLELYPPLDCGSLQSTISPTILILCATIIVILNRCRKLRSQSKKPASGNNPENQHESTRQKHWINSGERPIETARDDRFSRTQVTDRIVGHITKNERSIALIGPMGCGKSSILNLVFECIAKRDPSILVVKCDLWRARTPEEIPQIIISAIVNALDTVCDTIGLRDLPHTYRRLVAAEPSGTLHRIFSIENQTTSLHKLDRVDEILEILDRRIVLAVEDFERLPRTFSATHLSRFLWAIREIPRFSTIIAVDRQRVSKDFDFAKLCDSIEMVPEMPTDDTARTLIGRYEYWSARYKNHDLQINTGGCDKLDFDLIRKHGIRTYLLNPAHNNPISMITTLLANPRFVKQALHRIDQDWKQLHGEVDLNDLIILTVLRCCAPKTVQFVKTNIRIARLTSDRLEVGLLEGFRQEWKQVLSKEPEQEAVCYLVDLLGIAQLRAETAPYPDADASPQGVHLSDTTDYFARIISGTISAHEIRDQRVLRDIESSISGNHGRLAEGLVNSSVSNDSYISTWVRFSKPTVNEVLEISNVVIEVLLARDSSEVDPNEPVLVVLSNRLRTEQSTHEKARIESWLRTQATQNVSKSLSLASGLVLFCIRAQPQNEGGKRLAQIVLDQISAQIVTPQQLLNTLSEKYPDTVRVLLHNVRTEAEAENTALISLLLEAAELSEQEIIAQLIHLLVDDLPPTLTQVDGEYPVAVEHSSINFDRLHVLFKGHESDVVGLISRYSGSDERCLRVKKVAQERLASQDRSIVDSS